MARHYILDKKKNPVPVNDIAEWAEWFEKNPKKRRVRGTRILGTWVSTVFLGLNLSFTDSQEFPLIYETMIFGGELDQYQERYSTKQEALKGHRHAVKIVIKSKFNSLKKWISNLPLRRQEKS